MKMNFYHRGTEAQRGEIIFSKAQPATIADCPSPPSPLNGERAGVRGETNTSAFAQTKTSKLRSSWVAGTALLAFPPLTLTLSPLRGEGTAYLGFRAMPSKAV